jgi:SAM-dependent methyltransferase
VTIPAGVPVDWYRTSFAADVSALNFERNGEEKARLALRMLEPEGWERVLDLACATGRRTLELCRAGFDVLGVEANPHLLETAAGEAELQGLGPRFLEEDPRRLELEREFDIVLSLGGGAFEHFDYDDESLRAFEAASRALRPGGRLLMQTPNVLYVEAHLPERTWVQDGEAVTLIEQHWNEPIHRLDGLRRTLVECDSFEQAEPEPFQRRLYTVEELAAIFD